MLGGRLAGILTACIALFFGLGIALMVLAIIVFVLSYQLVISKSATDIRLLLQIGYRPQQIGGILRGSALRLLTLIFVATILALTILRVVMVRWLSQQDFTINKVYDMPVLLLGVFLIGFILWFCFTNIRKNVLGQA
ncbi:MAG: hypothetical protein HC817_09825 [Saprospiraceae bacterium]|nr:hypothetical protein [Saprospiraceae bacterium]